MTFNFFLKKSSLSQKIYIFANGITTNLLINKRKKNENDEI